MAARMRVFGKGSYVFRVVQVNRTEGRSRKPSIFLALLARIKQPSGPPLDVARRDSHLRPLRPCHMLVGSPSGPRRPHTIGYTLTPVPCRQAKQGCQCGHGFVRFSCVCVCVCVCVVRVGLRSSRFRVVRVLLIMLYITYVRLLCLCSFIFLCVLHRTHGFSV